MQSERRPYIEWLLGKCKNPKTQLDELFTSEAIDLLAERLITPLQIEHYLNLSVEEGYRLGKKPVTPEIINSLTVYWPKGSTIWSRGLSGTDMMPRHWQP